MLDSFGIFEGGGAKGLAHIGALKAAEGRQVRFLGVAGTSAGAIVAALVAAGWRADKLYNVEEPVGHKGPFEKDFLDFFDRAVWKQLVKLKKDAERTFKGVGLIGLWCRAPQFFLRNRKLLGQLAADRGFFRTAKFSGWLEDLLRTKVTGSGTGGDVLFKDMTTPLKIIATDLTEQRIQVFGSRDDETPNVKVSDAVAASIAIPFFFVPHAFTPPLAPGAAGPPQKVELVDGGLVSNFPAWVFDKERRKVDPLTPTLGFTLVARKADKPAEDGTLLDFTQRLFTTALAGDAVLEMREVANLHAIPLRVRVSAFDFDMDADDKDQLYEDGLNDAHRYFRENFGPGDPEEIKLLLEMLASHMRETIGKGNIHLRANVLMPIGEDRLKILYKYNMEDDADDRLDLSIDGGGAGACWQTHNFAPCDMVEARTTFATQYKMTKYEQAWVRPTLQALLCTPVFDHRKFEDTRPKVHNPLIAILSFDSDDDLRADFLREDIQQEAARCSKVLATKLIP